MTFVSILITFKRGKRFLKDCLKSISEQGLDDYEIILIANGVSEDIDDLIDNVDNIIFKRFNEELGVSKARNEALNMANGEYVYFMDSDDYLYEDALSKLVENARKTHADFINGQRIETYYIKNRFNEELEVNKPEILKKKGSSDEEFSMKLLSGQSDNLEVLTVLHALIKRDKIGDLRFNENKRYFSDYEFMIELVNNLNSFAGVEDAIYAKRISDDFVNLPSLNQEKRENKLSEYIDEYKTAKNNLKSNALKDLMAQKIFNYYYTVFSREYVSRPSSDIEAFMDISDDFKGNFLKNPEINALKSKDKAKALKLMKLRILPKKLINLITRPEMIYHAIYHNVYNKKPVNKKRIIFESFSGNYYTDSPKYIYEYLLKHFGDAFEYVWVINDNKTEIPGNPIRTKRFSLKYHKLMATSKYWVINTRQAGRLVKRPEQVIVSTWHGTPLKRLGYDMGNVYLNNPRAKESYIKDSSVWDYFISPNRFSTEVFRRAFQYDGTILETGYPRNDILYNANEDKIKEIKSKLNLSSDKKIILYAPTWRDDGEYDAEKVKFKLKLELDKLYGQFKDEYVVLVRNHYLVTESDVDDYEDFAVDVSKYDDIAELYLISDILITDYSSVFFDYANLKRPILFYMYDLDQYEHELRGFYIDIHTEIPGPIFKTTDEVIDALKDIDEINMQYRDKYAEFYNRFCNLEDGNASKRIVDEVWGKK